MDKIIVIAGASGFIGKYLVAEFLNNNYTVYAVVRSDARVNDVIDFIKKKEVSKEKNLHFVISDFEHLTRDMFDGNSIYAWIQVGWGGVNREEIDNPIVQEKSYMDSINCLKVANELGCKRFMDTGSRAEYSRDSLIQSEENDEDPLNKYGYYKKEFYKYASKYCEEHTIEYLHARLFSVIGPEDHPWSVVMTSCRAFLRDEPMLYGSCEQMWNFIDVRDVARIVGHLLLLKKCWNYVGDKNDRKIEIVNIASDTSGILRNYLESIHNMISTKSEMKFGVNKGYCTNPSVEKLELMIGNYKGYTFKESINNILDNIRV